MHTSWDNVQVDRKKLKTDKQYTPRLAVRSQRRSEEEYEPPSSALEEKIQKVWQEVLGQEKISVAADFFQIGGNSLRVSLIHAPEQGKRNFAFPPYCRACWQDFKTSCCVHCTSFDCGRVSSNLTVLRQAS